MRLTSSLLTTLLFASSSLASQPLSPWRITRVGTKSPPYSPGVVLKSAIGLTIFDDNTVQAGPAPGAPATFQPSAVNCTAYWVASEESVYDRVFPCDESSQGRWEFMVPSPSNSGVSPLTNFDAIVWHYQEVNVHGSVYSKTWEGRAHFEVGPQGNLEGLCGASGVCGFNLKAASSPVSVAQKMTACKGLCVD